MTQLLWPSAAVAFIVTKCCKFDSFTLPPHCLRDSFTMPPHYLPHSFTMPPYCLRHSGRSVQFLIFWRNELQNWRLSNFVTDIFEWQSAVDKIIPLICEKLRLNIELEDFESLGPQNLSSIFEILYTSLLFLFLLFFYCHTSINILQRNFRKVIEVRCLETELQGKYIGE